ncbi:MAG TPA: M3 family oligoendopeptidase [Phycisphaerales bacterium]|nr:M3 family oligoendopeptidase [Phycisphaerales bacterium]
MPTVPTDFVPADIDATDFAQLEPLFQELLDREIGSASELEHWLVDRSELEAAFSEAQALLFIAMTCNTDDASASKAYESFVENVPPKVKPLVFRLDRKQKELAERFALDEHRYGVLNRDTAANVDLFRKENVPIETALSKLVQKYDTLCGAMTVEFDGQERTLPQMGVYQESTDRPVRERAWRAVASRRLQDAEAINEIYDEMIRRRDELARNAGFDNFTGYTFKAMHRFDYSPKECFDFHEACEKIVVPFARRLDEQRRERLGVEVLRPWDMAVDERGRPPLRPFDGGADLISKTRAAFSALDPRLSAMFERLGDGSGRVTPDNAMDPPSLDLDSRKGKAPGGYQYMRDRSRMPFIFMNAAGLHRDLETMVHEAGHAFHSMLCVDEPLVHYRESPIEFAEVASMSMELLTMRQWGEKDSFYGSSPEDHARAMRIQLETSITFLPWMATIDAFQHWVYANANHTRDERTAQWLELDERFGKGFSWEGLDAERAHSWQRQGHLFGHPFYYIEYGIAQLGSLQLWIRSLDEGPAVAIDAYMDALRLGGSRPLPELFAAAGLEFDFGPAIVERLVSRVEDELSKLPD